MTIRLLIADDHEITRIGLSHALGSQGFEVVALVSNGEEATRLAIELRPHVAILDIRMCGGDGLSALREIKERAPDVAVVILSMSDNPTYFARAAALGAANFLFKTTSMPDLAHAIRLAAEGSPPPQDRLLHGHRSLLEQRHRTEELPLTKRQLQVLRHLGFGLENLEIAKSLNLSVDTVKEHVRCILKSLGMKRRTDAAVWAQRNGLTTVPGQVERSLAWNSPASGFPQ